MNRWEIDIPHGRAEEWRAHVAAFDGAVVLRDGARVDADKEIKENLFEGIIKPITEPVSDENVEKVSAAYNKLFRDAFSFPGGNEITETHLENSEELQRAGKLLYDIFHEKGHRRNPQYLAYIVKRYGLVDGESITTTDAAEASGFSPKYANQQHGLENRALVEIANQFSRDQHPAIIRTQSKIY